MTAMVYSRDGKKVSLGGAVDFFDVLTRGCKAYPNGAVSLVDLLSSGREEGLDIQDDSRPALQSDAGGEGLPEGEGVRGETQHFLGAKPPSAGERERYVPAGSSSSAAQEGEGKEEKKILILAHFIMDCRRLNLSFMEGFPAYLAGLLHLLSAITSREADGSVMINLPADCAQHAVTAVFQGLGAMEFPNIPSTFLR
jgi:hypothetical protein